jgi:hypothetical protein
LETADGHAEEPEEEKNREHELLRSQDNRAGAVEAQV